MSITEMYGSFGNSRQVVCPETIGAGIGGVKERGFSQVLIANEKRSHELLICSNSTRTFRVASSLGFKTLVIQLK
jgi:hypothetical protein